MTIWEWAKNNFPSYAEEIIVEEKTDQQAIQEILNKFKQPIPDKFVELKVEEGNYMGSTNLRWKDKPTCERYGFYSKERKWIQIDITHELMEILEITKGEDITHPLYLSPDIFIKKEPTRGAFTIEKEEEVFFDRPVSEKSAEKELVKRMEELKSTREKSEELRKELDREEREKEKLQEQDKRFRILSLLRKKKITSLENELKELRKRDWKGFYFWLHKKFGVYIDYGDYDLEHKSYREKVKNVSLLDEYGFTFSEGIGVDEKNRIKQKENNFFYSLVNIRCHYPEFGNNFHGFSVPIGLPPYDDNKSYEEFCALNVGEGGFVPWQENWMYPSEPYRKLFEDWRKEVASQTSTNK